MDVKIEAVTVCVDYSDHLSECIDNHQYVHDWIIVTHHRDHRTIKLCETSGIRYILSERIYQNGAYFAKGRAINDGLKCLDRDEWLLHIDADQKLPGSFTDILNKSELNRDCIYGAKRQHNDIVRTEINPATEEEHQRPLVGFFQLWHSSKYKSYPESSIHAGDDDQEMSLRFKYPDEWRYLDVVTEDVSGEFCKHWYGRKFHKRASALHDK